MMKNLKEQPKRKLVYWKLTCDHPLIEKIWQTGGLSAKDDDSMVLYTHLIFWSGERKDFINDFDLSQVNEFLENIITDEKINTNHTSTTTHKS